MNSKVSEIKALFDEKIASVTSSDKVEELRVEFLGKKGYVAGLMGELKNVPNEEKKEFGRIVNVIKQEIEEAITSKKATLLKEEQERIINSAEVYDESLPYHIQTGSYHPITLVQRDLERIFASMGFTIEDYSEIVDDYHCFEALNIPKHHPARDMQDTYYLSTENQLLKTHTSAAQNAIMRKYGAPLRAIFPGRCFRNESTDACHENTFFQMEGIMIDKNISISNLIYFMKTMLSEVFQKDVTVRLRPGFSPLWNPDLNLIFSVLSAVVTDVPPVRTQAGLNFAPAV